MNLRLPCNHLHHPWHDTLYRPGRPAPKRAKIDMEPAVPAGGPVELVKGGLGAFWRGALRRDRLPAILAAACATISAGVPVPAGADYAVTVESNIVFATGAINRHTVPGTKSLLLDVYRPLGASETDRALILVHGGSFVSGDRRSPDMVDAALHFAARGWVCLSIEYRLTGDDPPAPPWIEVLGNPVLTAAHAAMVDTKRAVRWVRAHAGDYGCDINRVAGLGHSAGAYCIIQAAISDEADYANDAGAATPDQWAGYLGKLNAAVEVSGGCSNTLAEFDAGDAPLMIWHGDSDGTVSYTEAVTIDQECLAHQIPHRFYTLPGAGHGVATWLATYEGRDVKQHAEEFLNLFFSLRLGAAADGDVVRLSWPSVSNALYDVESSPALMTPFSSAIPAFRATDDTASVEAPLSAPACFYRVRIRSGQP